ncbi:MAG: L-serine ammonia-lyase, iron-sulfur-dependent, subunit alpha [Saprospiraceae bacterium]|nr:L-serine ammonia-lyase, iron-sulfur-dependent, subunit alpha [Saprospiraceae bacterium]
MNFPSIFNDVIGPVMRGPSSSHCAAALRIGRMARDLMGGVLQQVIVQYDPNGSLATTHKSQGSDMGLFGGLLGWEADDDRLPHYLKGVEEAGLDIQIQIEDIQAHHPNTYKLTLFNELEMREMTAISLGGGMIEVVEIDGNALHMMGDYNETLIYTNQPEQILSELEIAANSFDEVKVHQGRIPFIQIKSQAFLSANLKTRLLQLPAVSQLKEIDPVLPVRSRQGLSVPFRTCGEMLVFNEDKNWPLWKLAQAYEMARGNLSAEQVFEKMRTIIRIMRASIDSGIQGTTYEDRILGSQSPQFQQEMLKGNLVPGDALNQVILFVSSMMEVKSSMGVIVAAPTAGSCGALPGAVWGVAERLGLEEDEVVKAMLSAGLIGVFIAEGATFAAEVGGCMAECGSGSGMAAAAIAQMAGGDLTQALSAASQALQNALGMICDPIANRVEAPCLGRNVMAASNALSCANMALAQYDALIPLDEVIATMDAVGNSIAHELRCTALGGLSITKTSKEIEQRLQMMEGGEETLTTAARRFKIC